MARRGLAVMILMGSGTIAAVADDATKRRQHGVHSHDSAQLSLLSDANHLRVEIKGAAAGFLGFEHAPETAAEVAAAAALQDRLNTVDSLFRLNTEAGCALDALDIDLPGGDNHDAEHDHEDGHDHDAEHDHEDGHDHDEAHHDDDHDHADVEAYYDFTCRSIDRLNTVSVALFDHFPGFTSIEAVALLADRQAAQTLRPNRSILKLR